MNLPGCSASCVGFLAKCKATSRSNSHNPYSASYPLVAQELRKKLKAGDAGNPLLSGGAGSALAGLHANLHKAMKPKTVKKKRAPMARNEDLEKDSPSRDQNHDESRQNGFDPEVARKMGYKPD